VQGVHGVRYRCNSNLDENRNNNRHAYFELISTTKVQHKAKRNEPFKIFHVASKLGNCSTMKNLPLYDVLGLQQLMKYKGKLYKDFYYLSQ
jgi:hypothetical protein